MDEEAVLLTDPPSRHADLSETSRIVEAYVVNRRHPPAVSCAWPTTSMASTSPNGVSHTPVRFEFTDLHQRCAPLAATYCCPVEWLLPTVSDGRVRAGATGPVAEHRCR